MNRKNDLPEEAQWDFFWDQDKIDQLKRESWSKKRIKNILEEYDLNEKKVLDAGCGSGFFSNYFCEKGAVTYSLDYSEEALSICEIITKKKSVLLKKNLLVDSIANEIAERFDLIFSDGLFEHFLPVDQDKIIRNLKTLLSPRGVIVTFVPNRFSPWELIRPFYMPGIKENPFIMRDLVDLSSRNDLVVIKKGGINTLPFLFSPDKILGGFFGMLLFTVSRKPDTI